LLAVQQGGARRLALGVGDPAPKLEVSKWVQGDPVKNFEPGKAYIVRKKVNNVGRDWANDANY